MTRAAYITNTATRSHVAIIEHVGKLPGQILALTVDEHLQPMREAKEFDCLECGTKCSALELYKLSDVPGDCESCADEFFCPHGMHPDDECEECEQQKAA